MDPESFLYGMYAGLAVAGVVGFMTGRGVEKKNNSYVLFPVSDSEEALKLLEEAFTNFNEIPNGIDGFNKDGSLVQRVLSKDNNFSKYNSSKVKLKTNKNISYFETESQNFLRIKAYKGFNGVRPKQFEYALAQTISRQK